MNVATFHSLPQRLSVTRRSEHKRARSCDGQERTMGLILSTLRSGETSSRKIVSSASSIWASDFEGSCLLAETVNRKDLGIGPRGIFGIAGDHQYD